MSNCWRDDEHTPHYWNDGPDVYWCDGSGRDYGDEDSERERDLQEDLEHR